MFRSKLKGRPAQTAVRRPRLKPRSKSRSRRLVWLATLAPMVALLYGTTTTQPALAAAPGAPAGWSTVFTDDFNGSAGSAPSSANWKFDTGPGSSFGTGEIETMTDSTANTHLDGNGNLNITALGSGSSWTSGRIQTPTANVGAPAGGKLEVTASIQQPSPSSGLGYWPAFWMLGPGQWPENGEIDIMEDVNALSDVAGTIHCGTSPGGPCNEGAGISSGLRACSGCQSGFHTYSMILDRTNTSAETITFYLDGNAYYSVAESQVGTATWQAAFDHNQSIILDLAMGGTFPDAACGCTTPSGSTTSGGTLSVDYVAAYTTTGSSTGSTTQALPGTWPQCASENGTCTLNGTSAVAFGANGRFNYTTATGSTPCTTAVFGDPTSGVVKSCYAEAAPPASNIWSTCAAENNTCAFSGVMTVAYGAAGSYRYATLPGGTPCTNTVFGDPISGTAKSCYLMGPPPSFATWTTCAAENGTCSFSGTHEVAYGANGQYFYGSFNGGTPCTNTVFGDPVPGTAKNCYYQ
ncbi:glycoside hydrolase family 16 protein [Streptomyces sp. NPDC050538]|uniref:glycoside hydrolase family 16 protein n=1 Tax=Streptomyces sp. NPDC050538 TaxID=3365627 RepID=UPI0037888F7D